MRPLGLRDNFIQAGGHTFIYALLCNLCNAAVLAKFVPVTQTETLENNVMLIPGHRQWDLIQIHTDTMMKLSNIVQKVLRHHSTSMSDCSLLLKIQQIPEEQ